MSTKKLSKLMTYGRATINKNSYRTKSFHDENWYFSLTWEKVVWIEKQSNVSHTCSKAIITRILIPQCCTHPYLNIIRLKPKSLSLLDLPFPLLLIGAWKRTATFPSLSWESRGVQWRRYLYILGGVYAR